MVAKVGELTLPKDETQFLISLCLCVVLFLTLNPLGLTCLIPAWIMESKVALSFIMQKIIGCNRYIILGMLLPNCIV